MGHLIDPDDCVLAVIDVQPGFLARVDDGDDIVQRIAFLAMGAQFCAIPVIATVESPETWGPLDPRLAGHTAVRKEVFGLADDPLAGAAVRDTGRGTVVLTGLETDVCVAHSALGLLDSGRRVVVVEDAVGSPGSRARRRPRADAARGSRVRGHQAAALRVDAHRRPIARIHRRASRAGRAAGRAAVAPVCAPTARSPNVASAVHTPCNKGV